MRQVTGSNLTATDKNVSIQLRLDGHSFSADTLPTEVAEDSAVVVELLTAKSVLVPEECFAPEVAGRLLWLSGVPCTEKELPVWSSVKDGVVVVMALNREIKEVLDARYGSRIKYSSPMLRGRAGEGRYLYVYVAGNVAYFKFFDGTKLALCEAASIVGEDDILCMVENILREFNAQESVIRVAGEDSEGVIKLLKQYHKVEKCE